MEEDQDGNQQLRLWIKCRKNDVQSLKAILDIQEKLYRKEKVRPAEDDGYMLVPTSVFSDAYSVAREPPDSQDILERLDADCIENAQIAFLPITSSPSRPSKLNAINPITEAITTWFSQLPPYISSTCSTNLQTLVAKSPKRWSVYRPLLLLPSGSFSTPEWTTFLSSLPHKRKTDLWTLILSSVSKREGSTPLTHLAVNAGIPSHSSSPPLPKFINPDSTHDFSRDVTEDITNLTLSSRYSTTRENVIRSPSSLIPLYNNFGPIPTTLTKSSPTPRDLDLAFWVRCTQNGLTQIWAPLYTMFSRGNITEKMRLSTFHQHHSQHSIPPTPSSPFTSSSPSSPAPKTDFSVLSPRILKRRYEATHNNDPLEISKGIAIDLYAGIGYFTFSYARAGFTVLAWEINPWSIEGLRRGCVANNFPYLVTTRDAPTPPSFPPSQSPNNTSSPANLHSYRSPSLGFSPSVSTPSIRNRENGNRNSDTRCERNAEQGNGTTPSTPPQIFIFHESNGYSTLRFNASRFRHHLFHTLSLTSGIRHVNCGLLPKSDASWRMGWELIVLSWKTCGVFSGSAGDPAGETAQAQSEKAESSFGSAETAVGTDEYAASVAGSAVHHGNQSGDANGGRASRHVSFAPSVSNESKRSEEEKKAQNYAAWLHLHENVAVSEEHRKRLSGNIGKRKREIGEVYGGWGRELERELEREVRDGNEKGRKVRVQVEVEHVEFVKTFAPGVWHCVFDVYVAPVAES